MYEQDKPSKAGRIIWTIVYICIAAGVTWLVLWLIFWRNPSPKTNTNDSAKTSQGAAKSSTGQTSSASTASGNTGSLGSVAEETGQASTSSATSGTTTTTTANSTAATTTTATSLVTTGPENVVIPVAIAVAGGIIYYNVRTRRQLRTRNS